MSNVARHSGNRAHQWKSFINIFILFVSPSQSLSRLDSAVLKFSTTNCPNASQCIINNQLFIFIFFMLAVLFFSRLTQPRCYYRLERSTWMGFVWVGEESRRAPEKRVSTSLFFFFFWKHQNSLEVQALTYFTSSLHKRLHRFKNVFFFFRRQRVSRSQRAYLYLYTSRLLLFLDTLNWRCVLFSWFCPGTPLLRHGVDDARQEHTLMLHDLSTTSSANKKANWSFKNRIFLCWFSMILAFSPRSPYTLEQWFEQQKKIVLQRAPKNGGKMEIMLNFIAHSQLTARGQGRMHKKATKRDCNCNGNIRKKRASIADISQYNSNSRQTHTAEKFQYLRYNFCCCGTHYATLFRVSGIELSPLVALSKSDTEQRKECRTPQMPPLTCRENARAFQRVQLQ